MAPLSSPNTLVNSSSDAINKNDPIDLEKPPLDRIATANLTGNPKNPYTTNFKRSILLLIFSLAQFVDVLNVSAIATCIAYYSNSVAASDIALEIGLDFGQQTWTITAYSATFAAFLLAFGRLSDCLTASYIFIVGFAMIAVLSLILSFVTNKYAWLVLRAICGIAGSATIPSAIHMITRLYPDRTEQTQALSLFGLSGAIANMLGIVLSGLFLLANYKWYFRFLTMVIVPLVALTVVVMPKPFWIVQVTNQSRFTLLRRLDLPGVGMVTVSLILFIFGITQGTVKGWSDAEFIAPFTLSWVFGICFFIWEWSQPYETVLLPSSTWSLPGFPAFVLAAFGPYAFWGATQAQLFSYWQIEAHYSAILCAARLLPQGLSALVYGGLASGMPHILQSRPKFTVPLGAILCLAGTLLLSYSDGGFGPKRYWEYIFTGSILGSVGAVMLYLSANTGLIMAVPEDAQAVAGAFYNSCLQIGSVIALSVGAGLVTSEPGGLSNWKSTKNGFWYLIALFAFIAVGFIAGTYGVVLRPTTQDQEEEHREEVLERDQGMVMA